MKGWYKLNCDGSCHGNLGIAGEGVCCSVESQIIFAFYEYYGIQTSMVAKTKAILSGLKHLASFPITAVWIEVDP